jgi:phosphoribosylanthranilate isomerase
VLSLSNAGSFIKICGVTSIGDAHVVSEAGADAVGLIFAQSSRQLSVEAASEIASATKGSILRVGVFRNNSTDFVLRCVDGSDVDAAQVHGTLPDELVTALRSRHVAIIKALSVESEEFFEFDDRKVDAVLVDGPAPGSGQTHAWHDLARRHFTRPVIAAGGLTDLNVVAVLETTNAWGVDVSSGVESAPGVKDPSSVRDFVRNARAYFDSRKELHG